MEQEEAIAVINCLIQRHLNRQMSDIETIIFNGAWVGRTYTQIADDAGYSVNYLTTDIGPKFWKLLTQVLGESVTKKNFKNAIQRQRLQGLPEASGLAENGFSRLFPEGTSPISHGSTLNPWVDWGEAPDVSQFYGRDDGQQMLIQWMVRERCRLIAVLGMGGIGKSTLATRVAQHLTESSANPFERVVWRSLHNAPPFNLLLEDLAPCLADEPCRHISLTDLLGWLRHRRCLLILDNVETILKAGDHAGYYRDGFDAYGQFFRLMGSTAHISCLLLTSREKLGELAALEGQGGSVRSLQLSGSVETAQGLIQAKGLQGTPTQRQALGDRYSYNPLALKIVSTTIHDLFEGNIAPFLEQNTIIFNSIRRLLDEQFARLPEIEQSILYWLAINREWTPIAELEKDLVAPVSRSQLIEALESLKWRGLIESQNGVYTEQPVVMEYVGDRLVEHINQELSTATISLLNQYSLLKTTLKDYIQDSQRQLILAPIATTFRQTFPSQAVLQNQIHHLLATVQSSVWLQSGYTTGNLINLCNFLQVDLSGYDFSHRTIRHADLSCITLRNINCTAVHFIHTRFKQAFGRPMAGMFCQDGQWLVVGDGAGNLRGWSVPDLQPVMSLSAHISYIWAIARSPDGRYWATSSEDQTMKVWDGATGSLVTTMTPERGGMQAVAWSPNGMLASGSNDGTVQIWYPLTGECLRTLRGHQGAISALSWDARGDRLASADSQGQIQIWDTATGTCIHQDTAIRSLAWHPHHPLLASSSDSGEIRIFNGETGTCVITLPKDEYPIWCIAWSPDGAYLASGSHDATVRLWDVQAEACLRILQGHTNWIWFVTFHPTQPLLVSGSHDGTLRLWEIPSGRGLKTLTGHQATMRSIAWNAHTHQLAAGCDDTLIRLWDAQTSGPFQHLAAHASVLPDLAFSPDGRYLASASHDHSVRIWDGTAGHCLHTLRGHTNWVWSVAWHPTQPILASGSVDHTIKLWDATTGRLLQSIQGHDLWVVSVAWSPWGTPLASSGADHLIRLWDDTGQCIHVLQGHQHWIWRLAWSPDGTRLASCSYDRTVRIWEWGDGQSLDSWTCIHILPHPDVVHAIAWHPDQSLLSTTCYDGLVRLWCPHTGTCVRQLQGHEKQALSLAFSADGTQLVSSSEDGTARLWDVETGRCVQIWRSDRPYEGLRITDVTGITDAQRATLRALGARE